MQRMKRSSVFVAVHGSIGQDLVFEHYTSKVVAARHPQTKKALDRFNEPFIRLKDANAFAFQVMKNSGLAEIYETCLTRSYAEYKKALKAYFEENKKHL